MQSLEISLKEVMVYVLYKWVPILLCAVIVGGVVGGYSYLQQPDEEELKQLQENFAWIETTSNAKIADLENKISDAEASIEAFKASNSFTNKKIARIYADIIYDQKDVKIDPIIYTYNNIFSTYTSLEKIFNGVFATDYSESYLRSVISLTSQKADGVSGRMVIIAIGGDELDPEVLAEKYFQYLVKNNAMFVQHSGAHSLVEVDRSIKNATESQTLYSDAIVNTYAQIDKYKHEIIDLHETIDAENPQLRNNHQLILSKVMLGFAAGLILAFIGSALIYVLALPVVTPDQIQRRLNINYLGGFRKTKFGTGLASRVSGCFLLSKDRLHAVEYAGANILEKASGSKTILITGSISEKELQSFGDELSKVEGFEAAKIIVSSNVNKNVDTIKLLSQVDAVILIESIYKSKITDVMRQADRIHTSSKDLIGYVLY